MAASRRFRFSTVVTYLALLLRPGIAQRPTNASVCDYYAQERFGANSSDTQLQFIQHVVCLAFEGGSRLNNVSSDITGILRPGKFNGVDVNLLQYFNGSRASTNVNNAAIGINWMDQGGTTPLAAFLAGDSQNLSLADSSNQYHLFGNFFVAFSRAFGCTLPPPPLPNTSGPISLAYAHKFMNLDNNQLGYFINQLSQAAIYYGVSPQDADTFRTSLNSKYNVRCAPAVSSNPSTPPMLLSLCQNPTCPLAVPTSDCAAYVNLTAGGVTDSKPSVVTSIQLATTTAAATGTGAPTATAAPSKSGGLSTGGIAGIAVAGAAILLIAVIALFYFRRHRKTPTAAAPVAVQPSWNQQDYGSPTVNTTATHLPKDAHQSYHSAGQPTETSRYTNSMGASPSPSSPDPTVHQGYRTYSGQHPNEMWTPPAPVEMGTARTPGPGHGPYHPPQNVGWSETQQHNEMSEMHDQGQYAQQPQYAQPQPNRQQHWSG